MKIDTEETYDIITRNQDKKESEFRLSNEKLFISIYRDQIYKNKLRVIPQEYLCNARDAHREVNQTRRIEVTTPSIIEPILRIRDFGPGINEERMEIFRQYGESTKRESNDNTGGFGIGCKCAWSYTDSFSITTVIEENGIRVKKQYHLYLTGNMCPGVDRLLSCEPTDDDIGTEISIPILDKDIKHVYDSIFLTIRYWDQNEKPLVDGKLLNDSYEINAHNYHYGKALCVVDGIIYPLDEQVLKLGKTDYIEVNDKIETINYNVPANLLKILVHLKSEIYFNTGEVSISPNREDLDYDVKTITHIQEKLHKIKDEYINNVKSLLNDCNNVREAVIKIAQSYERIICNGIVIPFKNSKDILLECKIFKRSIYKVIKNNLKVSLSDIDSNNVAIFNYKTSHNASRALFKMMKDKYCDLLNVDYIIILISNYSNITTHRRCPTKPKKNSIKSIGLYDIYFNKINGDEISKPCDNKYVVLKMYKGMVEINGVRKSKTDFVTEILNPLKEYVSELGYVIIYATTSGFKYLEKSDIDFYHFDDIISELNLKIYRSMHIQTYFDDSNKYSAIIDVIDSVGSELKDIKRYVKILDIVSKKTSTYSSVNHLISAMKMLNMKIPVRGSIVDRKIYNKSVEVIKDRLKRYPLLLELMKYGRHLLCNSEHIKHYIHLIDKDMKDE